MTEALNNVCEFEELGHTSEIGMRVRSPNLAALFVCAGRKLFTLIGGEADQRSSPSVVHITLDSFDVESLLVDWLGELLYHFEASGKIVDKCTIHDITDRTIDATVTAYAPRLAPVLDVKAVTYHQLRVEATEDGWCAHVFFDI